MPLPHRRRNLGFGTLALALALAASPPSARAGEAVYNFTIAGIRIGTLSLTTAQDDDGYTAASRIDATGVVGFFADLYFDGASRGQVRPDGTVVPEHFDATSKSMRAARETVIDWRDGTPVSVSVEPPRSTAPEPSAQTGTLDPVSAGFRLLRDAPAGEVCDTTVDVFDGSRRSRLKVGAAEPSDGGLVCEGTYARVEGEAHSLTSSREFPFRLLFRPASTDGMVELARIEAPTGYGKAVLDRRD